MIVTLILLFIGVWICAFFTFWTIGSVIENTAGYDYRPWSKKALLTLKLVTSLLWAILFIVTMFLFFPNW